MGALRYLRAPAIQEGLQVRCLIGLSLLVALGCQDKQAEPASGSRAAVSSKPPAPAGFVQAEYDEVRKIVAAVPRAARAHAQAEFDSLWQEYNDAAPQPRVLFQVPFRECCPSKDPECAERHLRFRGLCYENPTTELWGLGAFAIDDDGVFWIHDPVVNRVVGFDRMGKLVDAIPLWGPIGTESLVVTPTEVWLDTFNPFDDPNSAWLDRVDRKTHRARAYYWQDLIGKEYEDCGWILPGNPARIARWSGHWRWDIVDVSFLDDTRMQLSPPHPLHARGHRYWLDCDAEGKRPATLVIDGRAVPAPGCIQVEYIGPDGDTVADHPFYHFDVNGDVVEVAARTQRTFDILTGGNDSAIGPDGNAYQYVPVKHSVKFVQLPWFPKQR